MSGVAFTIRDEELAALRAVIEHLERVPSDPEILTAIGRSAQQTIKEHFEQLNQDEAHHITARSLGATPTGFYLEASQAVQSPQLEGTDEVSISIDHEGLAQRLFGGTIEARPGSYLTIPARAEAYGHRAREFDNLHLIVFPSGNAALVDKNAPAHEGEVYYWLVKQVQQQADPTVLPTDDEIVNPAIENVQRELEAIWGKAA